MKKNRDYRKEYDAAKRDLTTLIDQHHELSKRIVRVRQLVHSLAALCKGDVGVDPGDEAQFFLAEYSLADEIRAIIQAQNPDWLRPLDIRQHLIDLGHDLTHYKNPQATIHMVLKRLVESGDAELKTEGGKKVYRYHHPLRRLAARLADRPNKRMAIEALIRRSEKR